MKTRYDFFNQNVSPLIHTAVLSVTIGAIMISFSGVWIKISHVTPVVSAFYRVFFGGIILMMAAIQRKEIRLIRPSHLRMGIICGFFFALDLYFYHVSVHYVGPGLGTILPNFQVFILTAIGVLFLGERLSLIFAISIPMAMAGLFLIVGIDWQTMSATYRTGVYYGLAAAVCYSAFLISLRRLQAQQKGGSIFLVLMLVSLSTAGFIGGGIAAVGDSFRIPDLQTLCALAALGLMSQSVGWILITNALPKIRASLAGFILLLQPSLAFIWDVLFFNRPTTWINWIGVAVTLSAIYLGTVGKQK